jgi:O-acetyl-ADP-ribose deacetylase (regulator of RNase III)
MINKTRAPEYRDLQAALQKAMKAYENYVVHTPNMEIPVASRLWDEAMAANKALVAASTR